MTTHRNTNSDEQGEEDQASARVSDAADLTKLPFFASLNEDQTPASDTTTGVGEEQPRTADPSPARPSVAERLSGAVLRSGTQGRADQRPVGTAGARRATTPPEATEDTQRDFPAAAGPTVEPDPAPAPVKWGSGSHTVTPPPAATPQPPVADGPVFTSLTGPDSGAATRELTQLHEGVNWAQVRDLAAVAGDQITQRAVSQGLDRTSPLMQEQGRKVIQDTIRDHARGADLAGTGNLTAAAQDKLARAVFDRVFGLGRLQPLVDNESLENIEAYGHDRVVLIHSDGLITPGPAIAETSQELIDELIERASNLEDGTARPFSSNHPDLDLKLPGGHRLAASNWTTPWPCLVIRRHRLVDVTIADLVDRNVMDDTMASFLEAAVKAKKSIVVAGAQGVGKTTTVRALCNAIPPDEAIGTIETEYELFLHEMGDRHPRCIPWEARPGSGEITGGRRAGEVTLRDILIRAMRMNRSRIIVGEVRGPEFLAMIQAMQAGAGSLSTTHAYSARSAVERLVTCAISGGEAVGNEAWARREVYSHIDLIVQVQMHDTYNPTTGEGRRDRYVSEILALEGGEGGAHSATDIYKPTGPGGRGEPYQMIGTLGAELAEYGFDYAAFTAQQQRPEVG